MNEKKQLATNRSLLKFILLGIVTLGIYPLVIMTKISIDINTIASPYDNKKTMNFCLLTFVIGIITFGIGIFVWYHRISNRIGDELKRRGITTPEMSAKTFWLWGILGSFIIVGPFIYMHRFLTGMNELAADYNARG